MFFGVSMLKNSGGLCVQLNARTLVLILLLGLLFFSLLSLTSSRLSNHALSPPVIYQTYYIPSFVAKSPASFEYVDVRFTIVLYDNDTSHFNCFFSANNTGTQSITELNVSFSLTSVSNLQVKNETGPLYSVTTETLSTKTIIHLSIPDLPPGGEYNFTVDFDTPQVVSLTNYFTQFYYTLKADVNMSQIVFRVRLPPQRFLYSSGVEPLYPPGGANFTDGSSLIFQWNLTLNENDYQLFVIRYQLASSMTTFSTSYLPLLYTITPNLNPLVLVIIFLAGLGVGIAAFYIYHRHRLAETVSDTSLTLLNEAEVEILRVIASSENKRVTQKEIQKATNYSKAKVSITLSILEKKGFIKREPRGRTNIITLTKDIRV